MDLIDTANQITDAISKKADDEVAAYAAAEAFVLEGMTREELEGAAIGIFQAADMDNSGFLDRKEFVDCLRALDLGFTKKEIQYTMAQVDVNHDGLISYEEFLPLCFDLFVEIWQDKYMEASGTGNALEEQFMALFKQNDPEGSEKISAVDLRALLGTWGMSPMQVETTMAEAQIGGDGCVVYPKFARICAQYASAFFQGMPPQATKAYQDMGEDET